jgi:hypothetical protein
MKIDFEKNPDAHEFKRLEQRLREEGNICVRDECHDCRRFVAAAVTAKIRERQRILKRWHPDKIAQTFVHPEKIATFLELETNDRREDGPRE